MSEGNSKFLTHELKDEAVSMIRNGDDVDPKRQRRIILAIALDNSEMLEDIDSRLQKVEDHPFHKLTKKRIAAMISAFLAMTTIYIKESRDFVIEGVTQIVQALLGI
jgi:hypothetical protein